jgi:hypothetical protein
VIGDEFGEGRRICEENVAQYFWSGVRAASEAGSLMGGRGATSVAIVSIALFWDGYGWRLFFLESQRRRVEKYFHDSGRFLRLRSMTRVSLLTA